MMHDGPIRKPGSGQGVKEWKMNRSIVWRIKKNPMILREVAEEEQELDLSLDIGWCKGWFRKQYECKIPGLLTPVYL